MYCGNHLEAKITFFSSILKFTDWNNSETFKVNVT